MLTLCVWQLLDRKILSSRQLYTLSVYSLLQQAKAVEATKAKRSMEEFRREYDDLVGEDRLMDKGFKKDFADVPEAVADQLYKQYRRRPRLVYLSISIGRFL